MRFGISATSWIFPKNFLTRFRPINVCAIMSSRSIDPDLSRHAQAITLGPTGPASRGRGTEAIKATLRKAAIHRDRPDRRHMPYSPVIRPIVRITRHIRRYPAMSVIPGPEPRNHRIFYAIPGAAAPNRGFRLSKHSLLKLNLRADFFEGRLDLGGLVLVDAFLDRLGRAFDQVLGLFQAKARKGTDFLDDLDLLVAYGGENDRELGLFLGRGCRGSRGAGSNRNRSGSRDAPLLFEQLGEFRGLENCKAGEVVDDFLQISHELCPSVRTL